MSQQQGSRAVLLDPQDGSRSGESASLEFVWLEITGFCPLSCEHCYADSGPTGTHGSMQPADWRRVIDEVADAGVRKVQFIGGEPTLHPHLPGFVEHALARKLAVEVFSNLVRISPEVWDVLSKPGVRLATSYYSDDPAEHESITRGRGSARRTDANIAAALERNIPLRVGIIGVRDEQRVEQARSKLVTLGVPSEQIGLDYLREVGRGQRIQQQDASQLCGRCTNGTLAISPSGEVWPCVFSRWLPVGNVLEQSLVEILAGQRLMGTRSALRTSFDSRPRRDTGATPDADDARADTGCWPKEDALCVPWVRRSGQSDGSKTGGSGSE